MSAGGRGTLGVLASAGIGRVSRGGLPQDPLLDQ
jgi:hypothetical protein